MAGSTAVSRRPWKTWIGIVSVGVERVVAARVLVQLVVDGHHPAVGEVEDVEAAGALPVVEAAPPRPLQPVAAEIERRRQQHQPLDPRRATAPRR